MLEHIYALQAEGVMFYVGRSCSPDRRLKEHIASADPNGSLKERVIHQLIEEGSEITIKILETGSAQQLQGKESVHIVNLKADGHPLTNSKDGDSPLLHFEPQVTKPWSLDLFLNASWTKTATCKAGEVAADIKSFTFYRTGKRKLRFERVGLGSWDVKVPKLSEIEAFYEKAIQMLTPGTKENRFWESQVEQVRRLKPKMLA